MTKQRHKGVSAMDFKVGLFLAAIFTFLGVQVGTPIIFICAALILVTAVAGRVGTLHKIKKGEW